MKELPWQETENHMMSDLDLKNMLEGRKVENNQKAPVTPDLSLYVFTLLVIMHQLVDRPLLPRL